MSNIVKYNIDGIEYTKQGYFGCQLYSNEDGLRIGDTRVILEELMYVWAIDKKVFRKNIIKWSLLKTTTETVEALYSKLKSI